VTTGQSTEDELLILRCREGDGAALDRLLERWQEPLWRHACRLTGQESAAWDVLQEALLVIARDIRRLEAEAAFGAWAYRIVKHKAADWLRQHVRRREREASFAAQWRLEGEGSDEPAPEEARLMETLPRLELADRTLLELRFQDEFSIEEIAHMLGVPAGTVKSRLHYAKQRLRTLMEKQP
jgi:RNA polymerase sigma-70 factor, ECF subfamily